MQDRYFIRKSKKIKPVSLRYCSSTRHYNNNACAIAQALLLRQISEIEGSYFPLRAFNSIGGVQSIKKLFNDFICFTSSFTPDLFTKRVSCSSIPLLISLAG